MVGVSVVGLLAQEPQRPLTFDVTSVKPNTSGEQGGSSKAQPGRYLGLNVTLKRAVGLAYRPVQEFVGGPDWINTDRFDIEGSVEGTPTQDQMLEMLRSLLADRFKLAVHRETRQMPAYARRSRAATAGWAPSFTPFLRAHHRRPRRPLRPLRHGDAEDLRSAAVR
jgi:hypothetical protein